MKTFLITLFAIAYINIPGGVTIHLDYRTNMTSHRVFQGKSEKIYGSGNIEKAAREGCCYNEQRQIKTGKSPKVIESFFQLLPVSPGVLAVSHINLFLAFTGSLLTQNAYGLFHPV